MLRSKFVHCFLSLVLLALFRVGPAFAQPSPEFIPIQTQAPKKASDGQKAEAPKAEGPKIDNPKIGTPTADTPSPEAPKFEPLVSAALGDTSFAAGAPTMIGDFGAILVRRTVLAPTFSTITSTNTTTFTNPEAPPQPPITTTTTTRVPVNVPITIFVPVAGRDGSGFKIADGATPVPTDRVFFTWNGFYDLRSQGSFFGSASSSTSATAPVNVVINGFVYTASTSTSVQSATASVPRATGDLNREIFGFEKTFLDGNASLEVRAPIYQGSGDLTGDFNGTHFGDLTAVLKYALLRDPEGLTFSAGLATTFPTGQGIDLDTGTLRDILFQPFVGYLYRFGDAYVEGFTSVVLPTSSSDPDLLFNDIGVGYQFYKGRRGDLVRSIDSVLEVHVTTPLDNRGSNSAIIVSDIVSTTGGLHFGVGERAFLSIGLNGTLTGPRPYGIEAIVNFDYRF